MYFKGCRDLNNNFMEITHNIKELQKKIEDFDRKKLLIGFVPTMGALHPGHISLIHQAKEENNIVVCSIFVNPTQFNNPADLEKYPRMPEKDIEMLEKAGCNIVFLPAKNEVYPEPDNTNYDFGSLENVLEGKFRPGHFKGVGMVVKRLFEIVKPHNSYFGLKDYQQFLVIKKLVEQFNIPVKVVGCPTIRENDGLAMSSRNLRLSYEQRKAAPLIYESLKYIKNNFDEQSLNAWKKWFIDTINNNPFLEVEYVEIVDAETLQKIDIDKKESDKVICVAVFAGDIRLIDNVLINY